MSCKNISAGLFSAKEHALTFRESFNVKNTVRPGKIPLLDCQRDSHATSQTAIYANITQTGRIRVYCSWFRVVLVGFIGFVGGFGWFWLVLAGFVGGFGWFWLVPCFSSYGKLGQPLMRKTNLRTAMNMLPNAPWKSFNICGKSFILYFAIKLGSA